MRIKDILVEGIRSIDRFEATEVGDVIVLAGPNGSGKSSLLDAIRAFKVAYATAVHDFEARGKVYRYGFQHVQDDFPNLVARTADEGRVSLVIAIDESEQMAIGAKEGCVSGTVRFLREPSRLEPQGDIELLRSLFARFSNRLEHIPSARRFARGEVTQVTFSPDTQIQRRLNYFDRTSQKFEQFKTDLWWYDYLDMKEAQESGTAAEGRIAAVQEVFKWFLVDREFLGVRPEAEAIQTRFLVQTSRGEQEIDDLSSGEKEVLMTVGSLAARRLNGGVVLWDEPDLHLHGTIEARLLDFVRSLVAQGNQVWMATHSPEIVGGVDTATEMLFRMPGGPIGENIAQRVTREDERVRALEEIGATLYVQTVYRKVVWHEGPTDADILSAFDPEVKKLAHFIPAGGGTAVAALSDHLASLVQAALRHSTLIAVRDRDSGFHLEPPNDESRARIFVWSRREIENYLLDPEAIREVHSGHSKATQFATANEVDSELRAIADGRQQWIIARAIERQLATALRCVVQPSIDEADPEASALSATREVHAMLGQELAEDKVRRIVASSRSEIQSKWEADWKVLAPGKQVLVEFHRRHVGGHLSFAQYRDLIGRALAESQRIPSDVARVLEAIRA
jgi:predicted ATPase